MLSKLLRKSTLKEVQPHLWPLSAGLSIPVRASPGTGKQAENRHTVTLAEDQSPRLQARLDELESTVERRVKETRDAAYREGEKAGRNQASAEARPVLEKLARAIQDLAELRPTLRDQAEADVVRLALAIAKRIVHRELNTDPDSIGGLVKVALNNLRAQEAIRVRVHPAHQSIVREVLSHAAGSAHIEVSGDSTAGLGGVVFETARGEFDVSVDTQLKEIEKGLTDRLRS
jgi:flagellar assembly protein FliH